MVQVYVHWNNLNTDVATRMIGVLSVVGFYDPYLKHNLKETVDLKGRKM